MQSDIEKSQATKYDKRLPRDLLKAVLQACLGIEACGDRIFQMMHRRRRSRKQKNATFSTEGQKDSAKAVSSENCQRRCVMASFRISSVGILEAAITRVIASYQRTNLPRVKSLRLT